MGINAPWLKRGKFDIISRMATEKKSLPDSQADDSDKRPLDVLIIDNDEAHAQVVAESLDRVGFHCQVAGSGPLGAQMIDEGLFDVIITDLVMNDVDGLDILARAKAVLPNCEVILMTGHGSIPSAVAAMQQGAFNYLMKPLKLDSFV